jgi:hypothetical protein
MENDLIFINSYNRLSGSSNNFQFDISNQIRSNIYYDKVCLVNASIPKTYYLINNTSNRLIINEVGVDYTVIIQNGNYSLLSLCNYLNISSNLSQYGLSYSYFFSPNINTGKITITVTGNAGNNVILKFTNEENPALILGFDEINYTFNNSITSPNICNFELTTSISICSDIVENEILFSLTPNVLSYNFINYQNNSLDHTNKKISKMKNVISIYLIDNISGKILDLNGVNISLCICLFTKNIQDLYYKLHIEDYLFQNYLKKLDLDKKQLENKMDE